LSNVFTYDAVGNRTSLAANGVTTNYQYNALDQLISAGSAQYSYDGRGNLTQINDNAGTTTYSYDAANRLNAVALPGTGLAASYTFDADGRWASRGVAPAIRNYFWDELSTFGDVVAETDGSNIPQATYTLGGNELVQQIGNGNSAASYYLHDGLGNAIGLTDPNGVLTDRYRYDAFGTRILFTGTSTNNYLYRGQRNDEISGLLYLRSRNFAPGLGRFTTRDTANFDLADPQDLNRYTYAAANPINRYDPTGYNLEEYAFLNQQSAENSEINGYYVAREQETLISCFVMYVFAQMANIPLALSSTHLVNGKPNNLINYTAAFGHIIDAPLDALGRDVTLDPEIPFERAILLSKSWMFRNAPRQDVYSRSGRSDGSPGRNVDNWLAMFFPEFYPVAYQNIRGADLCAYHAELRILRWAQPPVKALLSVAASRPVCLNCQIQLWRGGVDCVEVRGINTQCLTSNWRYIPPGLPVH
jgi:RHS repeat-associated protein